MEINLGTEVRTWQIVDGKLMPVQTALKNEARTEPYDLEPWIASQPDIVSTDLLIVGRQVQTRRAPAPGTDHEPERSCSQKPRGLRIGTGDCFATASRS